MPHHTWTDSTHLGLIEHTRGRLDGKRLWYIPHRIVWSVDSSANTTCSKLLSLLFLANKSLSVFSSALKSLGFELLRLYRKPKEWRYFNIVLSAIVTPKTSKSLIFKVLPVM